MVTLQEKLKELKACEEAQAWVGERTLKEAWAECERLDWMRWLVEAAQLLPECRCHEGLASKCPVRRVFGLLLEEMRAEFPYELLREKLGIEA